MDFNQLKQKTVAVNKKFKNWKDWNNNIRFVDLVEEIGELANAVLTKQKAKGSKPGWQEEGLEDSLCDVLYDIFLLAEQNNVDLENEYLQMLAKLEKRIESGEFD
jgi:NTP pyrophosphatase (non-canonical NTP hydrolase)